MDLESRLIALVKRYEFIYNIKNADYKNCLKKEDTWNRIGAELNLSGEKCKRKWKSLRDSYSRAKQRNTSTEKVKLWKYEEQMRFLDNFVSTRKIFGLDSTAISVRNDLIDSDTNNQKLENSVSNRILEKDLENLLGDSNNEFIDNDSVAYEDSPPSSKKRKVENSISSEVLENDLEHLLDDSSNESAEPISSHPVTYTNSTIQKKPSLNIAMLYEKFEIFLESASCSMAELKEKSSNSTILLFESLAKKIIGANLTEEQRSDIEHSICMLVFTKLTEARTEKNGEKPDAV